jgi:hypothetical protein
MGTLLCADCAAVLGMDAKSRQVRKDSTPLMCECSYRVSVTLLASQSHPPTMSSAEADALRVRVKAQSEKIRQMKKAGSAQEEITSEVQMLQLMKADLEKMASAAQVQLDTMAIFGGLLLEHATVVVRSASEL